ncbi:hypothetical protein QOL99_02100 [Deinococcus sp. MIMF12]|uniref:Cytochrome c oxidase subunit 2A n=1 Tax=Deinococcus rhizophilus TaxID=3049544 RepID=A0ABT7JEM3_9DEIO|nr:hypothetical protein [Deinococcus rhizophilus]MDL2342935.1 hypothetical protein [Deinococcus rhizophilus]
MTKPPVRPHQPPRAQDAAHDPHSRPGVVPIGTLMVIAVLMLTLIWLWMLVLGIQQGRG